MKRDKIFMFPFRNIIIANLCNSIRRSHILQADSAELMNIWITALHKCIDAAIQYNRCDNLKFDSENMLSDSLPGAGHIRKM